MNSDSKIDMKMIDLPKYRYTLKPFGVDTDLIVYVEDRPSLWRRFWMRVLFGWRFEEIDDA